MNMAPSLIELAAPLSLKQGMGNRGIRESGNPGIGESAGEWTNCIIVKIFKNIEIVKFITITLKSILNLVKLQSLVAKCCKMQKI